MWSVHLRGPKESWNPQSPRKGDFLRHTWASQDSSLAVNIFDFIGKRTAAMRLLATSIVATDYEHVNSRER